MKTKAGIIVQLGMGRVGRALVHQYVAHADAYPQLRYLGLGDRSGLWVVADGWDAPALSEAVGFKSYGMPITRWRPDLPSAEVVPDREAYSSDLLWRLDELGFRRAILVDTTAPGSGTGPVLAGMRRAGCDVVLANREPLAGSGGTYDLLTRAGRGRLRWGATLPPGLPLQEAIRRATRGADRLRSIVCAPSGALGWILDALVRGSRFSTAVREAQLRGLLHSDPREDLSGRDARRLALLLARAAGWPLEADCLGSEGLVPDVADRLPPGIVLDHLTDLDTYYADRVRRAGKRGAVLRYVVRMGPHGGTAGLEELPSDDACARALEGDTVFTFYTEHGGNHPVVLQGPAGGADATAASLFSDIVSLL